MTELSLIYPDPRNSSDLKEFLISFIEKNINDFSFHEKKIPGWFGKEIITKTYKHPKMSVSFIEDYTGKTGLKYTYLINEIDVNDIFNNNWPGRYFNLIIDLKEELQRISNRKVIIDLLKAE